MAVKKKAKKNEVRRYVTMTVEFIEECKYDGRPDETTLKAMEDGIKEKLGADSVTITNVKDFVGE